MTVKRSDLEKDDVDVDDNKRTRESKSNFSIKSVGNKAFMFRKSV